MTEQQFLAAVAAKGLTEIEMQTQSFDYGNAFGVALQFKAGDKRYRHATRIAPDAQVETAYHLLLDWADTVAA